MLSTALSVFLLIAVGEVVIYLSYLFVVNLIEFIYRRKQ